MCGHRQNNLLSPSVQDSQPFRGGLHDSVQWNSYRAEETCLLRSGWFRITRISLRYVSLFLVVLSENTWLHLSYHNIPTKVYFIFTMSCFSSIFSTYAFIPILVSDWFLSRLCFSQSIQMNRCCYLSAIIDFVRHIVIII